MSAFHAAPSIPPIPQRVARGNQWLAFSYIAKSMTTNRQSTVNAGHAGCSFDVRVMQAPAQKMSAPINVCDADFIYSTPSLRRWWRGIGCRALRAVKPDKRWLSPCMVRAMPPTRNSVPVVALILRGPGPQRFRVSTLVAFATGFVCADGGAVQSVLGEQLVKFGDGVHGGSPLFGLV